MIVKQGLAPRRVFVYIRTEIALGASAGTAAYLLVAVAGLDGLEFPVALATVLGTALSILLAFRANTAYQRWWEASGVWAQITGHSRTFARVIVSLGDSKGVAGSALEEAVRAWQLRMVRRQIAWAHALRLELRRQDDLADVLRNLDADEAAEVAAADNRPVVLLGLQSRGVYGGYAEGILAGLDNFQLEQALTLVSVQQALAERVKTIPLPRQYSGFARAFVWLYAVLFPFTVIGTIPVHRWIVIPAAIVVAFVFGVVDRAAAMTENPFENRIQDVPLSAICTTIERDLLELAREPDRPPLARPVDGYLY